MGVKHLLVAFVLILTAAWFTGFRKCDIFRKACFKNGRFVDCHCYELLKL